MNARERFLNVMNFRQPDRNLLWEMGYWSDTLERWYGEGLSPRTLARRNPGEGIRGESFAHDEFSTSRVRDTDVHDALGFDAGFLCLPVNCGPEPAFEATVFEETETYVICQDEYGVKKKLSKQGASTPEFLGWQIENRADFERLKAERLRPELERRVPANWPELLGQYGQRDYPLVIGGYPCGFYGMLRYLMGEERLLLKVYDEPDLVGEVMSFLADFWIDLWDQVFVEITPDCAHFWEDMAYRSGPLISPAMFRQFMTPCYRRVTAFLKDRGVKIILVDSDGNLDELIPLFLEAGITGIFPIEIQAGNDLLAIRKQYPALQILGGIDKMKISQGKAAIDQELAKVPWMLRVGGYIPHVDHLVHPQISWSDFGYYRRRLKELIEAAAK